MAITLTVGVNSWVTLAESNQYFEERFGSGAWAGLSDDAKKQCLITAFRWIFYSPIFNIPASSTDDKVKKAQMELAWYVYGNFTSHQKRAALIAQGVTEFQLSKWEEKLSKGGMPQEILDILADEIINLGGVFPTVTRTFNE
jgi:hypothetical protein